MKISFSAILLVCLLLVGCASTGKESGAKTTSDSDSPILGSIFMVFPGDSFFSLTSGSSFEEAHLQYPDLTMDTPGFYSTVLEDSTYAPFSTLTLTIPSGIGLANADFQTGFFETSEGGKEIRSLFDQIRSAIDSKYGKSNLVDEKGQFYSLAGPKSWMAAIAHNDRTYQATWNYPNPKIKRATLIIEGSNATHGYLRLFIVPSS